MATLNVIHAPLIPIYGGPNTAARRYLCDYGLQKWTIKNITLI